MATPKDVVKKITDKHNPGNELIRKQSRDTLKAVVAKVKQKRDADPQSRIRTRSLPVEIAAVLGKRLEDKEMTVQQVIEAVKRQSRG